MRIHLLGLPHTQTTRAFSHCAFTGKVLRFAPMLRPHGVEVIHYGIEGAQSGANEQVSVLPVALWRQLLGHDHSDPARFVGTDAVLDSPLYCTFNDHLNVLLRAKVAPDDIVALPFGLAHAQALHGVPGLHVETGIGYPDSFQRFRVFESQAWYHWTAGKQGVPGQRDWHVIPNYFDVTEWIPGAPYARRPKLLVYFGRITEQKGLHTVWEIAKALPDWRVVLCGQGNPAPWLTLPNIEYLAPLHGTDRNELLRRARAVLLPTEYIEPFGGVAIEAMLSGTPVLTSDHSAFTETVIPGVTGWRCRVLGDWLAGVERVGECLDPDRLALHAARCYGMDTIGAQYVRVLSAMQEAASPRGWYTRRATTLPTHHSELV
jgi:glycosyltransferase involved in cell wall biosynthesis